MMKRREFITLLGGAVVARPLGARAQQPKVYRIGVLMGIAESDEESQDRIATFRQTLQELGWIEGRNVQFEVRFSAGDPKQARDNAMTLTVIVPNDGDEATLQEQGIARAKDFALQFAANRA